MAIKVAQFLDVSHGLQAKQFSVGSHDSLNSLDDLDPKYKMLLDSGKVHANFGVIGNDGTINLTPMWFDYEADKVLVNVAMQRKKVEWIRKNPRLTILLVNPEQMYHWVSIHCHVEREILEDDPEQGSKVTAQLDKIWTKYTGNEPPYGLRDPSMDERRVLFVCDIDRIATFGEPPA